MRSAKLKDRNINSIRLFIRYAKYSFRLPCMFTYLVWSIIGNYSKSN